MVDPLELVQDVRFDPRFDPGLLTYNTELGFLQDEAALSLHGITRLIGFCTPISRQGGVDTAHHVMPLTEFADLQPENRTIDQQGKGVGPRLYNTRASFGGTRTRQDFIGVYSVDLRANRLLDGRADQGGKMMRIARHANRMLQAKVFGLEHVVSKIHESYGDVDAVELEVPPHPALRQAMHGVGNPPEVKPQFIIIRNPYIRLHRIGSTTSPW